MSLSYENLKVSQRGPVLLVVIDRPQALNALNTRTMQELESLFTEDYKQFSGLKGVILTGGGEKAFVAGADIKEFLALEGDGGQEMAARGHSIFNTIERFHMPVLAAVNGFALGGGCELAMACHLRIAADQARFGQPEVNLGLIPGYGGTQRLVQCIGKTRALELLMTADMIDAAKALEYGLVNAVVSREELLEKSEALLLRIAAKAPVAISKIIACVNAFYQDGTDGFESEIDAFGQCTRTADFREGAGAFIEKRTPNFTGQ